MTNDQRIRELCKQIRWVAMNYPAGLDRIADQLREVWQEQARDTLVILGGSERQSASQSDAPQNTQGYTEQVRRKPGRPKKQVAG